MPLSLPLPLPLPLRVAVVGHVEHVEFVRVAKVPSPGAIVHASETWVEAAGGGGVAAVQLAKLAGACHLFTALGDDERGRSVPALLSARTAEAGPGRALTVDVAWRAGEPMRRGITFVDDNAERTITIIGKRHQPEASDVALPWRELDDAAVYFCAGSPDVLREVRARARVVVATSRVLPTLEAANVRLDAIVRSAKDANEPDPLPLVDAGRLAAPRFIVATEGEQGGSFVDIDGDVRRHGRWPPAPLPGAGVAVDAYGCGDSFAAGLTFALGRGLAIDEALAFAARCGAACLTGRGPFAGQLVLPLAPASREGEGALDDNRQS